MNEGLTARRAIVTGRVQGVFFRAWTKQQADALGLAGWVRNCTDGSVEAHLEGDEAAVEELIDRLHRGPPAAEVQRVEVSEAGLESSNDFAVRH